MAESRFVEDSLISGELLVMMLAVVIFPFTCNLSCFHTCLLPLTATFDFALYYVIYFEYVLLLLTRLVNQPHSPLSTRTPYTSY
jgi:hypothetical protein